MGDIKNMTKSILTLLLFIFSLTEGYSQLSKTEYEVLVAVFVDCIKNADIDRLDSIISYPIERPYPIPSINNKQEFKKRYSEIFDDSLSALITNSSIKQDWSDVGLRGIMLHNGIIWLDYDGRFLTTNYTTGKEKAIENKWIEKERTLLYKDLKNFKNPVFTLETEKFIVRIDQLENQNYRYASWTKESNISNQPDIVIKNGKRASDGSGGNYYYQFTNKDFSYTVYVNTIQEEDSSPFTLEVTKNDQVILNQPAEMKKIK